MSELASECGIHPTQLHRWRKEALEAMRELFSRPAEWKVGKVQYEGRIEELYTEIGRLSAQLSWLKKGISFESG